LCVLDPQGHLLLQQRIIHDVDGLSLLAERLNGFGVEMLVAIERAEGLLVEFLQTPPMLTLFCVSPKISARPGTGTGCRRRSRTPSTRSCWLTRCATALAVVAVECTVAVNRPAAGAVA
jgi:hypothetical protein